MNLILKQSLIDCLIAKMRAISYVWDLMFYTKLSPTMRWGFIREFKCIVSTYISTNNINILKNGILLFFKFYIAKK